MKRCSKCKETREESLFKKYKNSKDGLFCQCKYCTASTSYVEIVDLEGEIWKPLLKYKGYFVSNKGRVKSFNKGLPKLLTHHLVRTYVVFPLGSYGNKSAHSLVLQAFVGERPTPETQIDHIDSNKLNNCLENLEYVSAKENMRRAKEMGLRPSENANSKLSMEQVQEVKLLLKQGLKTSRQIATSFGISDSNISHIKLGISYSHIKINE